MTSRMCLGALLVTLSISAPAFAGAPGPLRLGIDRVLSEEIALIEGKRVGLVTNQSGVDSDLVPSSVRLARDPRVSLVQLYAPEHGLRGVLPAGHRVDDARDPVTGVPVQSLFGARHAPSASSLSRLDLLLFDIQDLGSRTYTYVTTMGKAMKAAARAKVPFVVLDRPNPQGGLVFEGPIRRPRYRSFIGWGPLPVTHGMTVGELARFYNTELAIGCELHVVRMTGWRRDMVWQDTGLTWVPTSPAVPRIESAQLYVATGMIGGVTRNVNEGVGWTLPFELVGATFLKPEHLAQQLNQAALPGLHFRPISYRAYYHRHRKKILHGVQIIQVAPKKVRPLRTALTILSTLMRDYPGKVRFRSAKRFAMTWGNHEVLRQIRAGLSPERIEAGWRAELKDFGSRRARYLIYP